MIAVIFEVTPAEGRADDYFAIAMSLKAEVEAIDGFISVERFASVTTPGKFLSLSIWRDEESVQRWRAVAKHRAAQTAGRRDVFAGYRLRVASVIRDYGMEDRAEAPKDSLALHG
ncbi:antibiotic biosynthesis monooxygenase family protein [Methylopila turkensis]|uniref:Antibiotic biosynthesis monooxygenase n=1 Tax=Methylopila turkensis TaxID=1437816 RepID=A0A9W6JNJ1_9HYPH|nr:antibiotic biosynthesis monooxygenase [Methylopila turkensis]GLK80447.1 antibiotic biosynthesis monooxygenase [Methylopila turkensis]